MTVEGLDRLRRRPYRRTVLGLSILAIAAPGFLVFNYVYRFGVNAVFWDEWKIVEIFNACDRGSLTWDDLLAPHSEHQIVVPRMIMLGLARLTHLNTLAPMYTNCVFLVLLAAIILREHLQTFGSTGTSLALFIPSAWLIFTLRQNENLLWGWQIGIALNVLGVAGAMYGLARSTQSRWGFPAAILCGIVSSLSLAAGMAVWPAGLVCMELSRAGRIEEPRATRFLQRTCWLAAAAVLVVIYLHGYFKPESHPSTAYALEHPREGVLYLLVSLGGALTSHADMAAAFGLLLLLVFGAIVALVATRRIDPGRGAFGAGLLTYWLAVGVLLAIGRGGFGPASAISSRYTTMTMLGAVGCWRSVLAVREDSLRRLLAGFVFAILCIGVSGSLQGALAEGFRQRNERRTGAAALRHYRHSKDADLRLLHPSADYVRTYATVLEKLQLNVFRDANPAGSRARP